MPYPKEFPYQLLGVGRAFSRQELVKAMGDAIKKHPSESAKYTTAYHALANTQKRLEYEILLPHENVEMEKELEQLVEKLDKASFLPQTCPALPVPGVSSILGNTNFEADFSEISQELPEMTLSVDYDNLKQTRLSIVFDK